MAMLGFSVNRKDPLQASEDLAARLICRPHGQTSLFRASLGRPPIGPRVAEVCCPRNKSTAGSSRSLSVALLMDERRSAEPRCSCLTVAAAWLGSTGAARLLAEFEETLQKMLPSSPNDHPENTGVMARTDCACGEPNLSFRVRSTGEETQWRTRTLLDESHDRPELQAERVELSSCRSHSFSVASQAVHPFRSITA